MHNEQVSILGLRASGKTCYLYAMAELMADGIEIAPNEKITISAKRLEQQILLQEGYEQLANQKWPQGSGETVTFDFEVKMKEGDFFKEVMSFSLQDYRGQALRSNIQADVDQRQELFDVFKASTAIIFMVDGESLLNLVGDTHVDASTQIKARHDISFIQSLFKEYIMLVGRDNAVPILLTVTKSDMFNSDSYQKGIQYLRNHLPELFNNGSGVFVAITFVSIGIDLRNNNSKLDGELVINTDRNIHIPMLFPLYCHWSNMVESGINDGIMKNRMAILRRLFEDRIDFYKNGQIVIGL